MRHSADDSAPLIVGGGPVGLTLALLLAQRGYSVRVFERRPDPRLASAERGRSINLALAARGLRALRTAEAYDAVQAQMIAMPGRMLHEPDSAPRFVPYGQRPGEQIYSINRAALNRLLVERVARETRIELNFGWRCVGVRPDDGTIELQAESDGRARTVQGALVVGADGAGSAVRRALQRAERVHASEDPLPHDYREFAIAAPPGEQWALEAHALHIWPRGAHMLIALPNADRSFTATLFLPRADAPASFAALADAAQAERWFAAEFPDARALLPDFQRQWHEHPQSQLATLYCWPWHARRALLLGDAAHAIVPFHGQGLNCGLEDCMALIAGLDAAGAGALRAPESWLASYEHERRRDTDAIAAMALENYQEMRDTVRSESFTARKQLANALELAYPERFIPRYSMVMFHPEIGYAEALRRGAAQEQILDALLKHPQPPHDLSLAAVLLDRAGL